MKDLLKGFVLGLFIIVPTIVYAQDLLIDSVGQPVIMSQGTKSLRLGTAGAADVTVLANDAVHSTFVQSSGDIQTDGHVDLNATGKTLILEDGTAASTCVGEATANGTTAVVISTTCIQTGDYVFISRSSAPSGTAECYADRAQITDATSFELDCDGAETGTFNWWIVKGQ